MSVPYYSEHLSSRKLDCLFTSRLSQGGILTGVQSCSIVPETALLSLLVSILAVLPLSIAAPPILAPTSATDRYVWLRFFSSVS
jgi:hypothetical protein